MELFLGDLDEKMTSAGYRRKRNKKERETVRKTEKYTANVHMARTAGVVFGLSVLFTSVLLPEQASAVSRSQIENLKRDERYFSTNARSYLLLLLTCCLGLAVKLFDVANQGYCYIVNSLRTWEYPIGDLVQFLN